MTSVYDHTPKLKSTKKFNLKDIDSKINDCIEKQSYINSTTQIIIEETNQTHDQIHDIHIHPINIIGVLSCKINGIQKIFFLYKDKIIHTIVFKEEMKTILHITSLTLKEQFNYEKYNLLTTNNYKCGEVLIKISLFTRKEPVGIRAFFNSPSKKMIALVTVIKDGISEAFDIVINKNEIFDGVFIFNN